jgi:hypothetical protein
MNPRAIAGILTALVLALILAIAARRPSAGPGPGMSPAISTRPSDSPDACLQNLIDDARAGDLDGYFDAFAEPLRSRLMREADETGRAAFATALRRASEARKGYALYAPESEGPDAVRVTIESVYPDRNERQVYRLVQKPDGWRIAEVQSAQGREPAARFGLPATYKEPEGVPVQEIESSESSEESGP